MGLFLFTMLFNGGLIPTYLTVRSLGIINTPFAMILPAALSVYQVIITRTFFQHPPSPTSCWKPPTSMAAAISASSATT